MQYPRFAIRISLVAAVLLAFLGLGRAQTTAINYQGRLATNGQPASGPHDFRFTVYDAPLSGGEVAGPITNLNVLVSNGVFTTRIDFGRGVFNGIDLWLGLETRPSGEGPFTPLLPLQPVTPTPYALYSGTAAVLDGPVTSGQLLGTYSQALQLNNPANQFTGNGTGLSNVNAISLGGLPASGFWRPAGNSLGAGQFLGSTNNSDLEFRVNNATTMRFSYRSNAIYGLAPSVIGGHTQNLASAIAFGTTIYFSGTTIGGGGYAGAPNLTLADLATVSGGADNAAAGRGTFIGGGLGNLATREYSSVLGGFSNKATNLYAVAMGIGSVAGGTSSTALGSFSTALGDYSLAAGRHALALHDGSFIWGDNRTTDTGTTGTNQFYIRAGGGVRLDDDAAYPTDLYFGSNTRQMINLWGTSHAIGVQSSTTYFRSSSRFSWYRNGVHSESENSPGIGGSVLMTLNSGGLTVNGTLVSSSDRNVKEDFQPVDAQKVLEKVVALPLSQWRYKSDEERSRHLGPMAQDFQAAFGLGADDKHIATVDADGVALAAIQGLNRKLTEELKRRDVENAELRQRLTRLEAMLNSASPTAPGSVAHGASPR